MPGKTLLGSDSHTPAAGALGMLAIGAGGLEVALAMAGEPFHLRVPTIWGVRLDGALPDWVSAKDVILEMLRRHGVSGGLGRIIEYYGPGLACLSAMDRHVIANMGAELGATTTVFPSDDEVRRFLRAQQREEDFVELVADDGASYDVHEKIDLSSLEPLIAMPSSPGNVVPVREVAGREIYQAYIGSSANPGYRDFAIAAEIVKGRHVHDRVSFDVNPTSRQILENLMRDDHIAALVHAGARLHQAGCNGCIGMGQAPATDRISLRTVPRNFPGRSGTNEDQVCLVSPETAAASALTGVITDPRTLGMAYPRVRDPEARTSTSRCSCRRCRTSRAPRRARQGPQHPSLPALEPLPDELDVPVLLKLGDDVSTDEILPAGARVLPYRSNIEHISEFAFEPIDPSYPARARQTRRHRARDRCGEELRPRLEPRARRARAALPRAARRPRDQLRAHPRENLVNFGVLPLTFVDPADYARIAQGDFLAVDGLHQALRDGRPLEIEDYTRGLRIRVGYELSPRQLEMLLVGGLIPLMRRRFERSTEPTPGAQAGRPRTREETAP